MSLARRMIEEAEKVSFRRNTEPLNQGPELACDALCQKLSRRLSNRRTSAEVKGREGQEPVAQRYVRTLRYDSPGGGDLRTKITKDISKRDKAFIWAALRALTTKRGSFIAAGAFDVIFLPDDLMHLLLALPLVSAVSGEYEAAFGVLRKAEAGCCFGGIGGEIQSHSVLRSIFRYGQSRSGGTAVDPELGDSEGMLSQEPRQGSVIP